MKTSHKTRFISATLFSLLMVLAPSVSFASTNGAGNVYVPADLTLHAWRILKITDDTSAKNEREVFIFNQNGQFNIVSDCSLYVGKYKADETGAMLITSLENTKESCEKQTNNNVMLRSLIMAQRFEINENSLTLLGEVGPLINLETTEMPSKDELQGKRAKLKQVKNKKHSNKQKKNKSVKKLAAKTPHTHKHRH